MKQDLESLKADSYEKRVQNAIAALKNGNMIIMMDDEDRENEGDLVFAAEFCTPELINFTTKYARGLVCTSITEDLAAKLNLPQMISSTNNDSNHSTAFTISIDSKDAKTGISAFERSETIKLLTDSGTTKDDFVRPGHIFPITARAGGVLERTGHTEASVDLCALAGLMKVAVICEIMKEDGSMARRDDDFLYQFSKNYNLPIVYVSDIVQYRLEKENLLIELDHLHTQFMGERVAKYRFEDHKKRRHIVYEFDGTEEYKSPYVRFHKIKKDVELLDNSSEYNYLLQSIEKLKEKGGFLIFLDISMDSSGANNLKNIGIGAQILKHLNVKEFNIISKNIHQYIGLSGFGLTILNNV